MEQFVTLTGVVLRDNTVNVVATGDRAGAWAVGGGALLVHGSGSGSSVTCTRCVLTGNSVHIQDQTAAQVMVPWGGAACVALGMHPLANTVFADAEVLFQGVDMSRNTLELSTANEDEEGSLLASLSTPPLLSPWPRTVGCPPTMFHPLLHFPLSLSLPLAPSPHASGCIRQLWRGRLVREGWRGRRGSWCS
jgi:hypothetical protein